MTVKTEPGILNRPPLPYPAQLAIDILQLRESSLPRPRQQSHASLLTLQEDFGLHPNNFPPIYGTNVVSLPSLFVSHGAPSLLLDDVSSRRFLSSLGNLLGKPRAIVLLSAHHDSRGQPIKVTSNPSPPTIYDFGGFDSSLYEMQYSAPGYPSLARSLVATLASSGIEAIEDPIRGFDHGAWMPLKLMYPQADVPVVQVSLDSTRSPRWHYALGHVLRRYREDGCLLIGSGSATHNLNEFFGRSPGVNDTPPKWVVEFTDWLAEQVLSHDQLNLLNAVEKGPHGKLNHPTIEHILPLFFAAGASEMDSFRARLHNSYTYGVLAMDAYAFGALPYPENLSVH